MASGTHHLFNALCQSYLVNDIRMARRTSADGDPAIPWFNLNWFVKVVEGKCKRVKKAIICFRNPFPNGVMGGMAIVTDSNTMMT